MGVLRVVDMVAISQAMTAFKAIKDTIESVIDLRDSTAFQAKRSELQSRIIDAQQSIFAAHEERFSLLEKVRELEQRISDFKDWESEKKKYILIALPPGASCFALKKPSNTPETPHWLCANCYQDRKKKFLNYSSVGPPGPDYQRAVWLCGGCGSKIMVSRGLTPESEYEKRQTQT